MSRCSCGAGLAGQVGDYDHGPSVCRRITPLFRVPDAFVRLGADSMATSVDDVVVTDGSGASEVLQSTSADLFQRNQIAWSIPMSREMLIAEGLILPTPAEAVAREAARDAYAARTAAEQAAPGPVLTLDTLLDYLGWSAAYAAHLLHPACHCSPSAHDPWLCSWAVELGFTDEEFRRD